MCYEQMFLRGHSSTSRGVRPLSEYNDRSEAGSSLRRGLLYPVLAICGIGWFGLIAMIYVASVGQNRVALAESERTLAALMKSEARLMASLAKDYTWWDDSIRNLVNAFDREWAGGNIGWYLTDNSNITQTVVFGGDDRIIYAQRDGDDILEPTPESVAADVLLPLARAARSTENRTVSDRDGSIEPIPVHGFVRVDGEIWAVGASVITPEGVEGSPEPIDDKVTLVLTKRFDQSMLAQMSHDFGLADLHLLDPGDSTRATLPVIGFDGAVIGRLSWTPSLPGTALLTRLIPAAGFGALLTLGLLIAFVRRSAVVVEEMERSSQALASQHALVAQREWELRTLVENVADGIVTLCGDGRVLDLNRSASRILGWPPEQATGTPVSELLGIEPGASDDWLRRLNRMAGRTVTGKRRDGSQFLMEFSVGSVHDQADGRIVLALRDVTERSRAQATLNLLATPMLVLDGNMKPVLSNASATALLDDGDGITMRDSSVQLWQPSEMTQFQTLVGAAAGRVERTSDSGIMTVSRPSGKQPYAMLVTAMRSNADSTESPLAVVFLRDPEHRWEVPARILQELYDLTPAESRVAIELVNGASPKEVARTFNVSVNTVRNQIKQTYRKTGTSRQSQLVALMLSTAALVADRLDDAA